MHNPYIGILAAALAAWIFGSVWYGVLGRTWMAALGNSPAEIEAKRQVRQMPYLPMAASFLCEILMASVLRYLLASLGVVSWIAGAQVGLALGLASWRFPAWSTTCSRAASRCWP